MEYMHNMMFAELSVLEQFFSKQTVREWDRQEGGRSREAPKGEATVKTRISLLDRCPLLVQHIIGGGDTSVCVCLCLSVQL